MSDENSSPPRDVGQKAALVKAPLRAVASGGGSSPRKLTDKERAEFAQAYFSRHGIKDGGRQEIFLLKGLSIVRNQEGIWLDFSTESGKTAMIHMDMIGPQGHPDSIVNQAIDEWCKEFIHDNPTP